MSTLGWLWFNDDDKDIVKDIAKLHKLDEDDVEEAYKKMIEDLQKNEPKK